ncbi:hypothetical protein CsSME_00012783 [Camellia sinensis var. sinensis]
MVGKKTLTTIHGSTQLLHLPFASLFVVEGSPLPSTTRLAPLPQIHNRWVLLSSMQSTALNVKEGHGSLISKQEGCHFFCVINPIFYYAIHLPIPHLVLCCVKGHQVS